MNLRQPPAIHRIHNTLCHWYSGLEVAPPLLRHDTPTTHHQSTPQQTDNWACGLHVLHTNLTTIYQGRVPTLTHTQQHAEELSRSHLRYILTGELDTFVTNLIHNLTTTPHQAQRTNSRHKNHTQLATNNTPPPAPPPITHKTRK